MSVFSVEKTEFGLRLGFTGFPSPDDVLQMTAEMQQVLPRLSGEWGVLVDMRKNRAFSAEATETMKMQIELCKQHGMQRAVVILQSAITALQTRRMASETGIGSIIRFLDAGSDPHWEQTALAWLTRGIEPEG